MQVVLLNKPYGVLCQFTSEAGQRTLADHLDRPGFYAAGRLDKTSEGLLVLTDSGSLQDLIAHPRNRKWKRYWVQVECEPSDSAIAALREGVALDGTVTLPAKVKRIDEPAGLWARDPPIRFRKHVPSAWLEIELQEGRNRQIRRMTASVGNPTLRLIRVAVGPWSLDDLAPGDWRFATVPDDFLTGADAPSRRKGLHKGRRVSSRHRGSRARRSH